ncbi:unnamed protein product [Cuscuta epithymum]|uniref:Uncharacterized protein n=1 Tax=Cuscuta epithymum TaxID=186058 RepID=A0AAV0CIM8_9ASTE|nr:unnamed protein product [Cuscuta epithymum]
MAKVQMEVHNLEDKANGWSLRNLGLKDPASRQPGRRGNILGRRG